MSQAGEPATGWPDLAVETVGGAVLAANDEFFAPKEALVRAGEPVWDEHRYTERGKWMDGWETRRRREPGEDWAVLRLGVPGILRHAVVDTRHFRGNYPEQASLEGAFLVGSDSPADLEAAVWQPLLERRDLQGDHPNGFDLDSEVVVSHVRLTIHPDGGVARLRLHGEPVPDWVDVAGGGRRVDAAALGNGGRILDVSDRFFSDPVNLLRPGPSTGMHDGWETRRRRGPGNDWVEIALGAATVLDEVVVDTSHFKGNAPGACTLQGRRGDGAWHEILPRTPLQPHTPHRFVIAPGEAVDALRLDIYPDGGVARVRAWGTLADDALGKRALGRLDRLPPPAATADLLTCCGSSAWAAQMAARRPFGAIDALRSAADEIWSALGRDDHLEAFAAHPRIGERSAAMDARSRGWSGGEQAGVRDDDQAALVDINRRYEDRFGWVFLICATGLDSAQILASARERIEHDPDTEIAIAAEEQRRITHLRLDKLLGVEGRS